jgi:hypothetical protein
MAQQLVYTSAAKLLDAGRSGFGTVARSKALSPLVVSALERVSQFANIRGTDRSRVIFVHRRIIAANNRLHVLSRITDAGADYTGRTNHIAHHLIVSQEEMARAAARGLTPADILLQFPWLDRWEGAARFFAPADDVALETFQPLGRQSARREWSRLTGNPAHTRLLAWEGAARNGVLLVPQGAKPLPLLAEALAEFGAQSWSRTFTTSLETTDEMSDLDWIVTTPAVFREIQSRCGARACLDLSQPRSLPVPPEPVQAAPQAEATPQAPGMPEASAPDKPQAKAVRVRTLDGSTSGQKSSRAPLVLKPEKKQNTLILTLAIAAAVTIVLGLIVWNTFKPKETDDSIEVSRAKKANQDVVSKIKNTGVSDEDANKIAVSDRAEDWASFIADFIGRIIEAKNAEDFNSVHNFPNGDVPDVKAGWLKNLVRAKDELKNSAENIDQSGSLKDSLESLGIVFKSLKNVAENTKNADSSVLTLDHCKRLDRVLAKKELDKVLKKTEENTISQKEEKQLNEAISSGLLSCSEFPQRYEILADFILKNFNNSSAEKIIAMLDNNGNVRKSDDVAGFKLAIGYLADPGKILSPEDQAIIGKSDFVPKEFDAYRKEKKNQRESTQAVNDDFSAGSSEKNQAPKPPGPDLSGVNRKQVIVIGSEQLKAGVEVELLKLLIKDHTTKLPEGLEICVGDQPIQNTLNYFDEEKHFADKWKNPKYSVSDSGVFRVSDVRYLTISYKKGDKKWEAWILADEKDEPAIADNIKLEWMPDSEDLVEITAELAEWIKSIKNDANSKARLYLKITADPPIDGIQLNVDNGVIVKRTQNLPVAIFSERDAKSVDESLENLAKADVELKSSKGTNEKKVVLEKRKDAALNELDSSLKFAIYGGILSQRMGLEDESKISETEDQKNKARKIFVDCGGEKWGEKSDWEKEFRAIKEKVGSEELSTMLKKLNIQNWDGLKKSGTVDPIKKAINGVLEITKKSTGRKSLDEEFRKTKSITISTPKGRVLFKATQQP